jgi:hypothetical protein
VKAAGGGVGRGAARTRGLADAVPAGREDVEHGAGKQCKQELDHGASGSGRRERKRGRTGAGAGSSKRGERTFRYTMRSSAATVRSRPRARVPQLPAHSVWQAFIDFGIITIRLVPTQLK